MVTEAYVRAISGHVPEFPIKSVKRNENGQNNVVLEVNDEFIFRFPKYREGITQLKRELRLLEWIQGYVSLPIPAPVYVNIANKAVGEAFAGYKKIRGEPLWKEAWLGLSESGEERIAGQLARFLADLHRIPVEPPEPGQPSAVDWSEWHTLHRNIQMKLFPYMSSARQSDVDMHFESFFGTYAGRSVRAAWVHGDFGTSNILFDPSVPEVTGIIDFAEAHPGDPALDIAGLIASYGHEFVELFRRFYPNLEGALDRASFYAGTFALQEALFGLDNDDQEAFRNGIKDYV